MKDCSSAFTAHKIHSNNWPLSVHAQQLRRRLLPRSVNKTILKPAVVARPPNTAAFALLFVFKSERDAEKSYAYSGTIASEPLGRAERGDGGKAERVRRPPVAEKSFVPPGIALLLTPVSSLPPVPQSPGQSSSTPAVVPGGGVQLVSLTALHSSAFSIAFPTDCACAAWLHRPPQPVLIRIRTLLQNTALHNHQRQPLTFINKIIDV